MNHLIPSSFWKLATEVDLHLYLQGPFWKRKHTSGQRLRIQWTSISLVWHMQIWLSADAIGYQNPNINAFLKEMDAKIGIPAFFKLHRFPPCRAVFSTEQPTSGLYWGSFHHNLWGVLEWNPCGYWGRIVPSSPASVLHSQLQCQRVCWVCFFKEKYSIGQHTVWPCGVYE